MVDQAELLRKLAREANMKTKIGSGKLITITSGKGGVGKSNFVVNLGLTLQSEGKKVLIFDADIGMGNDDVLLGIFPKHNVMDVIKNKISIEEAIVKGERGIDLLPGGRGLNNIEDLSQEERQCFLDNLEKLSGYDYILIDTGAGISRSVLAFVASSQEAIFVITPEPTSLTDGYSLLKALKYFKIDTNVNIVVNRVIDDEEGKKTYIKFNKASKRFLKLSTTYLGCIYEDSKLTLAVRKQRPFILEYPRSKTAKCIEDIASNISGIEIDNSENGIKIFFNKLFDIFS